MCDICGAADISQKKPAFEAGWASLYNSLQNGVIGNNKGEPHQFPKRAIIDPFWYGIF